MVAPRRGVGSNHYNTSGRKSEREFGRAAAGSGRPISGCAPRCAVCARTHSRHLVGTIAEQSLVSGVRSARNCGPPSIRKSAQDDEDLTMLNAYDMCES